MDGWIDGWVNPWMKRRVGRWRDKLVGRALDGHMGMDMGAWWVREWR